MGANAPLDRTTGATLPPIPPDPNALTSQQSVGLSIFADTNQFGGKCANCHVPPVTSGHTVIDMQPDAQGVPAVGGTLAESIETMVMGDGASANYDHGMYNIAVRRTTEDIGRAGTAPFTNPLTNQPFPLSLTELAALRSAGQLPPDVARFIPDMPVLDRRVTNGAVKVPDLRNTKLTGPYFHNGDSATLRQVVEFYTRGANFPNTNFADLAVDIDGVPDLMFPDFDPIALQNIQSLVAFMADGLLDQRVVLEKAPFDHPQLLIPHGSAAATPEVDLMGSIAACGATGHTWPVKPFLNLDPQAP